MKGTLIGVILSGSTFYPTSVSPPVSDAQKDSGKAHRIMVWRTLAQASAGLTKLNLMVRTSTWYTCVTPVCRWSVRASWASLWTQALTTGQTVYIGHSEATGACGESSGMTHCTQYALRRVRQRHCWIRRKPQLSLSNSQFKFNFLVNNSEHWKVYTLYLPLILSSLDHKTPTFHKISLNGTHDTWALS